jgi:hypothetical protein
MIGMDGKIMGETNPKVVPETMVEAVTGISKNSQAHLKGPNDPSYSAQLKIDKYGNVIGLSREMVQVLTETKAEALFLKSLDPLLFTAVSPKGGK